MTTESTSVRTIVRILCGCLVLPLAAPGWDRRKAFTYLEARQQQWADWKPAQKSGGACISCHTGLPYMMALHLQGEKQASPFERALIQGVKSRAVSSPPRKTLPDPGAEAVLNLWVLSLERSGPADPLSKADEAALKELWKLQIQGGKQSGSWTWVNADLEPFDSELASYFGTTLAEMALSAYPAQPRNRVDAMRGYLKREAANQPLHNRLAWIAFRSRKDQESEARVLGELWAAQSSDGGWSSAALGPWTVHDGAPADSGSNAYATAWAAFSARRSGVSCTDVRLTRAIDWLEKRQDPATGAWNSVSMNKVYPQGSMPSKFMTDAATGYAAATLIDCKRE